MGNWDYNPYKWPYKWLTGRSFQPPCAGGWSDGSSELSPLNIMLRLQNWHELGDKLRGSTNIACWLENGPGLSRCSSGFEHEELFQPAMWSFTSIVSRRIDVFKTAWQSVLMTFEAPEVFKLFCSWFIPHSIHGAGIFAYIYHKNPLFM